MNLVKQGAGTLVMPNATHTYKGKTDVWEGTLTFDGKLPNSRVFLNRHTALNSDGGEFGKSIEAYYNAIIRPGGQAAKAGSITADSLILRYGAVVELDIYSDGLAADKLNANVLLVEKKNWKIGPKYLAPVFRISSHAAQGATAIADGVYDLGTIGKIVGDISNIAIEGMTMQKATLSHENGKLLLTVKNFDTEPVTWTGANNSKWNVDGDVNFQSKLTEKNSPFYNGSDVTFDDRATNTDVILASNVAPASITFANETAEYNISGNYSIVGEPDITKKGAGKVVLSTINEAGFTFIEGGSLYVSSLANTVGTDCGTLGKASKTITLKNEGALGISKTMTSSHRIVCGSGNGTIDVPGGVTFTQSGAIACSNEGELIKTGSGAMVLTGGLTAAKLTVNGGSFDYSGTNYTKTTTLNGTSNLYGVGLRTAPLVVSKGARASLTTLTGQTYTNNLTGGGQITIYSATQKGSGWYATRTPLQLKMTNFEGTIVANATYADDGRFTFDTSSGSDTWTLNIPANRFVQNSGKTLCIGAVTGSGTLGGTCTFSQSGSSAINTWQVGNDTDFQFDGAVVDNAKFTKMGSGKMTANAAWTTTGAVNINEGMLISKMGTFLGTGALTVGEGGSYLATSTLLKGTSTSKPITNSSVVVSGTFQCGSSATTTMGFLYFGAKSLTIKSTGTYRIGISKPASSETSPGCTHIFGDGEKAALTLEDGVTVEVYLSSTYDPTTTIGTDKTKTDTFQAFSGFKTTNIGSVTFVLPALPYGYVWDTTDFANGYLSIRYDIAAHIQNANTLDGETKEDKIYNINGVRVKQIGSGVYIKNGKKVYLK